MKTIRVMAVDAVWMLELDGQLGGQFGSKDVAIDTAMQWAAVASTQSDGVRVLIPTADGPYQVKVFTHVEAA